MGTKSCPKMLSFFTKFSCENLAVEDFVTVFMGKNLVDGEMFCLGMVSTNLYMLLLLCGGHTKFKVPNGNGNVFFPEKRVRVSGSVFLFFGACYKVFFNVLTFFSGSECNYLQTLQTLHNQQHSLQYTIDQIVQICL